MAGWEVCRGVSTSYSRSTRRARRRTSTTLSWARMAAGVQMSGIIPAHQASVRTAGRGWCQSATFDLLFAFLVLGHGRRQLLWIEVTRHPTAAWLARQITEAFPWASAPTYLVRDNDRVYGHVFTSRVKAMGIRDRPISPGSPWQNGIAERLIGTLRRECLDHMLIFGEAHLRRILSAYAAYYNQARPHMALQKDAPLHRAVQRSGAIVGVPILAGLHHQYVRI